MNSFSVTVQSDVVFLSGLRRTLSDWLETMGVGEEPRESVVLATHEAAANAIEHGKSHQPVNVQAHLDERGLTIEVSDHGMWRPAGADDEERGRGLVLIAALVSDMDITTDTGGTTVRMTHYPRPVPPIV